MKRSFLIVCSNLRKAKGQMAVISVLLLLAALMLNLSLMLMMDYKQNFNRCHDKLNDGHVTLVFNDNSKEIRDFVTETLENDNRTVQYQIENSLYMAGSFRYNNAELSLDLVALEKETALKRSVGRAGIVEDSRLQSGVYLPIIYNSSEDIASGSKIDITVGSDTVINYTVCGFFNSTMAGSHNCGLTEILLTADKYKELADKKLAASGTLVSVRMDDKTNSEDFEADLKNAISKKYPAVSILSNSYTLVYSSRYISQMICSAIISAMAAFVTLIGLVVITSNISNYIHKNMKNLGALKAIGYRSRQVIMVFLLQFLSITLIAVTIGIGLSYCMFPALNTMMAAQTGIPYDVHFLPVPSLLAVSSLCGVVALAVYMASYRIRKIEPVTALRQGVLTHSFKRNHIPLEHTKVPLSFALALKTTFAGIKQNITICLTMFVLSLVIVFSVVMLENVILDTEPFINMIVGETADSSINVDIQQEKELVKIFEEDTRVEKAYLYHMEDLRHVGGISLLVILSDNFMDFKNQDLCIEGRFPKYNNEVATGARYAKDKGIKIGEEITLEAYGKKAVYIVTGFTQNSNFLGKDCMMTRDGYKRMAEPKGASYYLDIKDGVDIDKFNEEISSHFGNGVYTINIHSQIKSGSAVYVSLMSVIVIVILAVSVIIILFVLYILIRSLLNNKKHDYGVMKAIGFTTRQLMLQTALSFMPAAMISAVAGIIISKIIINPLLSVFLSGIGIVKCNYSVSAGFIIAAGTCMVMAAFGIACLLSIKIKKIAPEKLLSTE